MNITKNSLVDKLNESAELSLNDVFDLKEKIYTFLNPVSYLIARKNKKLFLNFDGVFVDGSILIIFIKMFYRFEIKRNSFDMTSFAPRLFEFAILSKKTICLIGSVESEVNQTIHNLQNHYNELNIIGYRNGYFSSDEEIIHEIDHIIKIDPDFVIVGMGIIKQEDFLVKLQNKGYKGIGFTCGGFIHQTSLKLIDFYPKWIDSLNIRFIYRIIKEKHTRKRYFKAALIFPIVFIYDKLWGVDLGNKIK